MQLNATLLRLLQVMADGGFHSGESLGSILGISRAAVWKTLANLHEAGIAVERIKGKGYRIPGGLSLLESTTILQLLPEQVKTQIGQLEVQPVLESTNSHVLAALAQKGYLGPHICLAEMQTAGRGRRGRTWQSPFARNIYLSLTFQFEQGIAAIEGLSLAVGVVIVEVLQKFACKNVALKWPNDILYEGKKLGGVLIEISGDVSGRCVVVVGIGLNVAMPPSYAEHIDQPWIDLYSILTDRLPSRNVLVAELIQGLFPMLQQYEDTGFQVYQQAWERHAAYLGQQVKVSTQAKTDEGIMLGVTGNGSLRLAMSGGERVFVGGEVSLRVVE